MEEKMFMKYLEAGIDLSEIPDIRGMLTDMGFPVPEQRRNQTHPMYKLPFYELGDRVRILHGDGRGLEGSIIIDRNHNYADHDLDQGPESIAVFVYREKKIDPDLQEHLHRTVKEFEPEYKPDVIWIESSDELEPVMITDRNNLM